MKASISEETLILQIGRTDLLILREIDKDYPEIVCKIKGVPGDVIIDFFPIGNEKVVTLSEDGFLSCADFSQPLNPRIIGVKRLLFEDNEIPKSVIYSSKTMSFLIATFRLGGGASADQKKDNLTLVQPGIINIHILIFDIDKGKFGEVSDIPFEVNCGLCEKDCNVECILRSDLSKDPILFLLIGKESSEIFSMRLKNDTLKPFKNISLNNRAVGFVIEGHTLWVLEKRGVVKVYN